MKLIDELYDTIRFVNESPNAVFDMDKIEDIFAAIEDKLQFYEKLQKALDVIKKIVKLDDYLDMCLKVWNTINEEEYNLVKEAIKA